MIRFLEGPFFTYTIITLYMLRCGSYAYGGHWGRAMYWLCAMGIVVATEFMIRKWP